MVSPKFADSCQSKSIHAGKPGALRFAQKTQEGTRENRRPQRLQFENAYDKRQITKPQERAEPLKCRNFCGLLSAPG